MRIAVYAHPFDLDALASQGGLARLRDAGVQEVALACSYHDGRWLQPWNPERRVRFLEDGTLHFRPRGDYGRLLPLASSEVPPSGPSPLERLCSDAPKLGIATRAWTVLTHNSRLGLLHPELCVENAFGDRYFYALCPSRPEVQHYELALLRDLAAHQGLATIELEALGQMGFKHSSHHDKASFSPKGALDAALSACFCAACRASLLARGRDAEKIRQAVRDFVDASLKNGDAMAPEQPAAGEWLAATIETRAATIRELAAAVVQATGTAARAVQVHPDPAFTGSQLPAAAAAAFPSGDERVLTAYGEDPGAIEKLLAHDGARALADSPRRLCIWPKAPQFTREQDLTQVREVCERHGIASLAIYHLGLLPWRTVERVAKMFAA